MFSHAHAHTHTHNVHGAKDDNDKNLTKDYTQDDDDTKNSKKQWECENGLPQKTRTCEQSARERLEEQTQVS